LFSGGLEQIFSAQLTKIFFANDGEVISFFGGLANRIRFFIKNLKGFIVFFKFKWILFKARKKAITYNSRNPAPLLSTGEGQVFIAKWEIVIKRLQN